MQTTLLPCNSTMRRLAPLAVLLATACLSAGCHSEAREKATVAQGNVIIAALEQHRNATGQYPDRLTELVPAYLPQLDPPLSGGKWKYVARDDNSQFLLQFAFKDGFPVYWYESDKDGWGMDTG